MSRWHRWVIGSLAFCATSVACAAPADEAAPTTGSSITTNGTAATSAADDPDESRVSAEEAPAEDVPADGRADAVAVGEGWEIDDAEFADLVAFVEQEHGLDFRSSVGATPVDDIGASRFAGFEPVDQTRWEVFRLLGIAGDEDDRSTVNEVRLDRLRGLCCEGGETMLALFEPQRSEEATAMVIVHELSHAMQLQYPDIFDESAWGSAAGELIPPAAASFEGIPQYVALRYGAQTDPPAEFEPIFREEDLEDVSPAIAGILSFPYEAGPTFVAAVVEEQGIGGLVEAFTEPPSSTEHVLFPDRYLAGEVPTTVDLPSLPDGASMLADGTIGAFVLSLVGSDDGEAHVDLVDGWAGDRFVLYDAGSGSCLAATIELDDAGAGQRLADHVTTTLSVEPVVDGVTIQFVVCG